MAVGQSPEPQGRLTFLVVPSGTLVPYLDLPTMPCHMSAELGWFISKKFGRHVAFCWKIRVHTQHVECSGAFTFAPAARCRLGGQRALKKGRSPTRTPFLGGVNSLQTEVEEHVHSPPLSGSWKKIHLEDPLRYISSGQYQLIISTPTHSYT